MNMPIDTVTIAFIELRSRLHGLAMRLLRNETDAQDTLQDAWLRLHRHGCPDSTDEARRKLPVVVRNLCIDRLRDRRLHPSADCDEAPEQGVEMPVEDIEALRMMLEADLTPRQKEIFNLIGNEGMEYTEVAQRLGMTVEAMRVDMSRARKKMRENYNRLNP